MSEILDEFWIFSKEGEPLVHFEKSTDGSPGFDYGLSDLDPLLLLKIQKIIKKQQSNANKKQKLMKFNEQEFNFAQCLKNDSVIFYKTNNSAKEKKIKNVCKIVGKIFEDAYKLNQLKFAEGNLDVFKKFQKKLAIYSKLSDL